MKKLQQKQKKGTKIQNQVVELVADQVFFYSII